MVFKEQHAQYFTTQQTTDKKSMTDLSNINNKNKTTKMALSKSKSSESFSVIVPQSVKGTARKRLEPTASKDNSPSPGNGMWRTFKRIQRSKKVEEVVETAEEKKMKFKAKKSVAVNCAPEDEAKEEDDGPSETTVTQKGPPFPLEVKISIEKKLKMPFRALLTRSMTDAKRYDSIEDIKTEMDEVLKQRSWKNETNKTSKNKLNKQLVKTKKAWKSYEYEPGQLNYDKYYRMKEKHKEKMSEKRHKSEVKTGSLDLEKYSALEKNDASEDMVEIAIKEREKKAEAMIKQKLRRKKEKKKQEKSKEVEVEEIEDIIVTETMENSVKNIDEEKYIVDTQNETCENYGKLLNAKAPLICYLNQENSKEDRSKGCRRPKLARMGNISNVRTIDILDEPQEIQFDKITKSGHLERILSKPLLDNEIAEDNITIDLLTLPDNNVEYPIKHEQEITRLRLTILSEEEVILREDVVFCEPEFEREYGNSTIEGEDEKQTLSPKRKEVTEEIWNLITSGNNYQDFHDQRFNRNKSYHESEDMNKTWYLLTDGSVEFSNKIEQRCDKLTQWSRDRGLSDVYHYGDRVLTFIQAWRDKIAKIKSKKKVRFSSEISYEVF